MLRLNFMWVYLQNVCISSQTDIANSAVSLGGQRSEQHWHFLKLTVTQSQRGAWSFINTCCVMDSSVYVWGDPSTQRYCKLPCHTVLLKSQPAMFQKCPVSLASRPRNALRCRVGLTCVSERESSFCRTLREHSLTLDCLCAPPARLPVLPNNSGGR